MAQNSPTISIRLPEASRRSLDKAAKATRRSRSFLMKEALDRYLADVVQKETAPKSRPLEYLLSLQGAGKDEVNPRTAEEINASIRWLRGSD